MNNLIVMLCCRYRARYWRQSVFSGIALIRQAVESTDGPGVSAMIKAAFRWLNHHSGMDPQRGGKEEC